MKSANSRKPRDARRAAVRPRLVAPLCLLALACGLLAGGSSRASAVKSEPRQQETKAAAAGTPSGKGAARPRSAQVGGGVKRAGAKAGADAEPLIFGCANPDTAITLNGPAVTGTLASTDCRHPGDGSFYDAYTFSGTAGQLVTITLTSPAPNQSGEFDTYLYLVRPSETTLSDHRTIQHDDIVPPDDPDGRPENLDSQIVAVLTETGTYTIMANSAVAGLTGTYQLEVRACAATTTTTIPVNTTVGGSLASSDCRLPSGRLVDVYSFPASAGRQVVVQMASQFDTFLFLLSIDGFTDLARNDDAAPTTTNSRIPSPEEVSQTPGEGFATLPANGTYYVLATSFAANVTGDYQVRVDAAANPCPTSGALTTGQTVNGTLATTDCRLPADGSFIDVYTFEGTAGQQIAVTMQSSAFNAFLFLYDPEGYELARDNNGGGGTNARIPTPAPNEPPFITLPSTGTYRIYANAFVPGQTGAYTLSVIAGASCNTVTLAQAARTNVPAAGGQFTDGFTVPAGCPVPPGTSNAPWITGLTGSVNSAGQGTFTYTVAQNTTGQSRTGTITVGGQTFTVVQLSNLAACPTVTLSPSFSPFGTDAGSGRFAVVVEGTAACSWTAATSANWITLTQSAGSGTGRVAFNVAANTTGVTRTGTITVNGQTHTVTQTAPATTPTVAFSSATYSAGEGDASRSITISVSRLGGTSGASTVEYRTVFETTAESEIPCNPNVRRADGSAFPQGKAFGRCDFATTVDTLTFAPNETDKTFQIPLVNDVHVEGAETFQIELANPRGATLGAPSTAAVTINDDDTAQPTTNPVRPPLPYGPDSPRFFVRMHYLDFLSREPEPDEPWTAVLLRCPNPENAARSFPNSSSGCDRISVSRSFFESPEFALKGFFVFLHHKASFGSASNPNYYPEYRDIVTDLRRVTGSTGPETAARRLEFSEEWVTRPAFLARYPATMSNATFVDTLLANVSATVTQAGSGFTRDSLVADLNAGVKTRADVVRLIAESQEVVAQQFKHAYVAMQYYGYLRRTPDASGYQAWLAAISPPRNESPRVMIDGFMNSTEYVFRFGPN